MLVLASASPRRAALLTAAGYTFVVRPVDVDESLRPDESPHAAVHRLASAKAALAPKAHGEVVLAADTLVAVDDVVLGKPRDADEARAMLLRLSGRPHQVMTGVACEVGDRGRTEVVTTRVWMAALTDAQVDWYVASGEPFDKAGGYGIQGLASRFVTHLEGSYTNVVGLPVATVAALLAEHAGIC